MDKDPLRARREVRELIEEIASAELEAVLDFAGRRPGAVEDKGWASPDVVSAVLATSSLAASLVQIWLARVPQRTILVTRADGATLSISGREAAADSERIDRFLFEQGPAEGDDGTPTGWCPP